MGVQETWAQIHAALLPLADLELDLSVYPYWEPEPALPAIDMYPASPFQDGSSFGITDPRIYLVVRARVAMHDPASAMELLLRLLDPNDPASVEAALYEIGAAVVPDGVSGFTTYADDISPTERMIGCDWRIQTFA